MIRKNSPYTAAFTGAHFMLYETIRILPLLLDDKAEALVKQEIQENKYWMVNSLESRKKYSAELKRRFQSVPRSFWTDFLQWDEPRQRIGMLYVLLSTYRILLEFHINVTIKKWHSINHQLCHEDIAMELSQIAAQDEFVDSWNDSTKKRIVSAYLTFLQHAGLYDKKNMLLHPAADVDKSAYAYYLQHGQEWFVEACLLYPYEIDNIKQNSL